MKLAIAIAIKYPKHIMVIGIELRAGFSQGQSEGYLYMHMHASSIGRS